MCASVSFLGIDVGKSILGVAVGQTKPREFPHTPAGVSALLSWARRHTEHPLVAVCESSGPYSRKLARLLAAQEIETAIVPPQRVRANAKALGRRSKTDRIDAAVILDFAVHTQPRPWTAPPAAQERLSALLASRSECQQEARRWRNRLSALTEYPAIDASLLDTPQRMAAVLEEECDKLLKKALELVKAEALMADDYALLLSIPGVGTETALALLAHKEVIVTRNAKTLTAYAGLDPIQRQSGSSLRGKSRLGRSGNSELRSMLYMASLSAARFNPLLKSFYERMRSAGKTATQAHCAVARKLLLQAQAILLSRQPFDPTHKPQRD
jgi:transposase